MPDEEAWPAAPPSADPTGQVFVAADDEAPAQSEPEAESPDRPSALRTATVVSGRIVLGFVVLVVLALVVAAATVIPVSGVRAHPASTVVTPVPTAQQLVCPGGLLRLGTSTGTEATRPSAIGVPQVASGAVPGDVIPSYFAVTDAGTGKGPSAPRLLTTPPVASGASTPILGGAQSEKVSTSEFSGLASASCGSPTGDTWLVGGATSVGRTTLLLLANPTAVVATVSVRVFGETGQVTAPGMDGITVAPGSQHVLSIAGFAPGLASPVVHVTSTGGQIVANLEQSTIRGLDPGGIDFVGVQAKPLKQLVIPGVVVSGSQAIQGIIGQSGFDDLQSILRIFVPGGKRATVSISVVNEDGTVTGKPTTVQVEAGSVTDQTLDSLSDGDYTLVLSSTEPIVAAARVSTAVAEATNPPTDFAWAGAAPRLTAGTVLSVASGMTATAHLENPTGKAETVRLEATAGHSLTVTVRAHAASSVPVVAGVSYELTGFDQLYASVSGATDGGVTSYAVYPAARAAGPLRVFG